MWLQTDFQDDTLFQFQPSADTRYGLLIYFLLTLRSRFSHALSVLFAQHERVRGRHLAWCAPPFRVASEHEFDAAGVMPGGRSQCQVLRGQQILAKDE